MENWNIKEETGKQYVYVSKLGNDTLAKNYFGYADVWQSDTVGQAYVIGDRRRSSTLSTNSSYTQWKCIANHNKGATVPQSDATNWEYDLENYQEYLSTKTYGVGSKTVYLNEHYTCGFAGTTGAFDLTKWTKDIISNKDYPFYTLSLSTTLVNGGVGYNAGRYISHEAYDYVFNVMYHNIHIVIGEGIWSNTVGPLKYLRYVGTYKLKTFLTVDTYAAYPPLYQKLYVNGTGNISYVKTTDCICNFTSSSNSTHLLFAYNSIFLTTINYGANPNGIYHCVNNIFLNGWGNSNNTIFSSLTTIKNNYFGGLFYIGATTNIGVNKFDYNCYKSGINFNYVLKSTISDIKAADTNQNIHSIVNTGVTFTDTASIDYTLPDENSPLYRTGPYGRNIGPTNIGFKKSELDVFSGATYKNIKIDSGKFVRDQINKNAQSANTNTIILSTSASTVDNEYDGFRIKIVAGTGIGQTRTLTGYTSSTKIATVTSGWTITPDTSSVYDILDGEVYSPKIDLGRVVRVKNAQFFSNLVADINGKYIEVVDWDVTSTSKQPKYTFKMDYSTDDVTYSGLKEFLIDEPLRIDSNGYGNGDSNFVRTNQVDSTITVRYCYINFALREI